MFCLSKHVMFAVDNDVNRFRELAVATFRVQLFFAFRLRMKGQAQDVFGHTPKLIALKKFQFLEQNFNYLFWWGFEGFRVISEIFAEFSFIGGQIMSDIDLQVVTETPEISGVEPRDDSFPAPPPDDCPGTATPPKREKSKTVSFDQSVAISLTESSLPIKQVSKHHYVFRRGSTEVHIATYDASSASDVIGNEGQSKTFNEAFKYFSCIEAMLVIIITVVIKLSAVLSDEVTNRTEQEYMLTMYVVCFVWTLYYNLKGFFIRKRCLLFSKSHETSNRWLKGVVVLFGLAIILKDSLEFIAVLMADAFHCHENQLSIASSVFHAAFILSQVNYLFKFSKVYIRDNPASARLGLMLIIAANLSSWIGAVIDEALHSLSVSDGHADESDSTYGMDSNSTNSTVVKAGGSDYGNDDCKCNNTFCSAVRVAETFLFPFLIEFSLVASSLLVMTWSNIGKQPPPCEGVIKPSHKFYKSYGGVALGVLSVFATIVVCVALGTNTNSSNDYYDDSFAIVVYNSYLFTLETCMLIACFFGFYLFRRIQRPTEPASMLDNILLVICVLGPLVLNLFSVVAIAIGPDEQIFGWEITILTPFCDVFLSLVQLTFILYGLQRLPITSSDAQLTASDLMGRIESQLSSYQPDMEDTKENNKAYLVTRRGSITAALAALANGQTSRTTELLAPIQEQPDAEGITNCAAELDDEDMRSRCSSESSGIASDDRDAEVPAHGEDDSGSTVSHFDLAVQKLKTKESVLKIVTETRVARPDKLRLWLRDVIMFLIISNACLWVFLSLDGTAFKVHVYESIFFGASAWTTIVMICRPLNIFYRMHSSGCLFEMWSFA